MNASALVGTIFVAGGAQAAEPLVTAEWLQDNLDNENVRVFEVSVDTGVYERGHTGRAIDRGSRSLRGRSAEIAVP